MRETVKCLGSPDGKGRVVLFRRDDGSFGFSVQKLVTESEQDAWISTGNYSECFASDAGAAESEARARVAWLGSLRPNYSFKPTPSARLNLGVRPHARSIT